MFVYLKQGNLKEKILYNLILTFIANFYKEIYFMDFILIVTIMKIFYMHMYKIVINVLTSVDIFLFAAQFLHSGFFD